GRRGTDRHVLGDEVEHPGLGDEQRAVPRVRRRRHGRVAVTPHRGGRDTEADGDEPSYHQEGSDDSLQHRASLRRPTFQDRCETPRGSTERDRARILTNRSRSPPAAVSSSSATRARNSSARCAHPPAGKPLAQGCDHRLTWPDAGTQARESPVSWSQHGGAVARAPRPPSPGGETPPGGGSRDEPAPEVIDVSDERTLFPITMRGYDRVQVEAQLAKLEKAVEDARARVEAADARAMQLTSELADAQRQLREADRPSYAGLGSRIEQLLRSAEEQSADILSQANSQAADIMARAKLSAGQVRSRAENEVAELLNSARLEAEEIRSTSASEAEGTLLSAQRRAEELVGSAEREAARIQSAIATEASERPAETAAQREAAERESAEMLENARREAQRQVDEAQRKATEAANAVTSEMEQLRDQARTALADAELEVVRRREEAERENAERHAAAKAETEKLVSTAEEHAAEAEKRVALAREQAEKVRSESDAYVKDLMSTARRNADQIVAEARAFAEQTVSDAKAEAEQQRNVAQRQLEDLTRQHDSINTYLDELRGLLGGGDAEAKAPVKKAAVPAGTPAQQARAATLMTAEFPVVAEEPAQPAGSGTSSKRRPA